MDYKTNLVLHISFSLFFLFLVQCLYSIVFLISFMDFLINKSYLVSHCFLYPTENQARSQAEARKPGCQDHMDLDAKTQTLMLANNKGADQPAHP